MAFKAMSSDEIIGDCGWDEERVSGRGQSLEKSTVSCKPPTLGEIIAGSETRGDSPQKREELFSTHKGGLVEVSLKSSSSSGAAHTSPSQFSVFLFFLVNALTLK